LVKVFLPPETCGINPIEYGAAGLVGIEAEIE